MVVYPSATLGGMSCFRFRQIMQTLPIPGYTVLHDESPFLGSVWQFGWAGLLQTAKRCLARYGLNRHHVPCPQRSDSHGPFGVPVLAYAGLSCG